jgi:hypothetical protein
LAGWLPQHRTIPVVYCQSRLLCRKCAKLFGGRDSVVRSFQSPSEALLQRLGSVRRAWWLDRGNNCQFWSCYRNLVQILVQTQGNLEAFRSKHKKPRFIPTIKVSQIREEKSQAQNTHCERGGQIKTEQLADRKAWYLAAIINLLQAIFLLV